MVELSYSNFLIAGIGVTIQYSNPQIKNYLRKYLGLVEVALLTTSYTVKIRVLPYLNVATKTNVFLNSAGDVRFFSKVLNMFFSTKKKLFIFSTSVDKINHSRFYFSFGKILYLFLLNTNKGMALHASSISNGKTSVLFCGRSGEGKTTIAKNSGYPILNDEFSIIRIKNKKVFCYGNPLGSKLNPHFLDTCSVVNKVYFIKKSCRNKKHSIGKSQTLQLLLTSDFFLKYFLGYPSLESFIARQMESIKELISTTKFQLLEFKLNYSYCFNSSKPLKTPQQ